MKTLRILLLILAIWTPNARAEMAASMVAPQPPLQNPHPPVTVEDHRRVDFAVAQIRAQYGSKVEIRHPHVIPWSFEQFEKNRKSQPVNNYDPQEKNIPEVDAQLHGASGAGIAKPMPPMQTPVLKPDEFMVHAYVRYEGDPSWHHLDVILSENALGQLSFRGFFDVVMPSESGHLPPGVVC